jgi:hypothetical protein
MPPPLVLCAGKVIELQNGGSSYSDQRFCVTYPGPFERYISDNYSCSGNVLKSFRAFFWQQRKICCRGAGVVMRTDCRTCSGLPILKSKESISVEKIAMFEFGRRLHRKVGRLDALQDAA